MSYNYSSDSDVSLFDLIEQSSQQAPPLDLPPDDWLKNMTQEQLESMRQYIMKQQQLKQEEAAGFFMTK